jgi:hypothetical protein
MSTLIFARTLIVIVGCSVVIASLRRIAISVSIVALVVTVVTLLVVVVGTLCVTVLGERLRVACTTRTAGISLSVSLALVVAVIVTTIVIVSIPHAIVDHFLLSVIDFTRLLVDVVVITIIVIAVIITLAWCILEIALKVVLHLHRIAAIVTLLVVALRVVALV